MKLDIGCGLKKREGYIGCDARPMPGIDCVCEADSLPFESNSIDEVYSRHLIEHFTLRQFIKVLSEWNRVLKVGGKIYIICPNMLFHLKQILEGTHESYYSKEKGKNARYWGFGSLFGWQQDESFDVHKYGYYYDLLRDILESSGFESTVNLTNSGESLEKAEHHLEVSAIKKNDFLDYKTNLYFDLLNVKH